jgi:hypothetical protein
MLRRTAFVLTAAALLSMAAPGTNAAAWPSLTVVGAADSERWAANIGNLDA